MNKFLAIFALSILSVSANAKMTTKRLKVPYNVQECKSTMRQGLSYGVQSVRCAMSNPLAGKNVHILGFVGSGNFAIPNDEKGNDLELLLSSKDASERVGITFMYDIAGVRTTNRGSSPLVRVENSQQDKLSLDIQANSVEHMEEILNKANTVPLYQPTLLYIE